MARIIAAAATVLVSVFSGTLDALAQQEPPPPASLETDDVEVAAAQAHVDVTDLRGASATTGMSGRAYLESVGELAVPVRRDAIDRLVDCLEWQESRGDPSAVNRWSGAGGPLQFLLSTWQTTPQGRAGLSRFDRAAAHAAARWMIGQGRLAEWPTRVFC